MVLVTLQLSTLFSRLQIGDKPDTPLFGRVWAEYESTYVNAVTKFLRRHEFCTWCSFVVIANQFLTR